MRIHTDKLNSNHLREAARYTGVGLIDITGHGSRSRDHAFNFSLTGSSSHRGQFGDRSYQAATWDEWGIFLAELFAVDPIAHTGKNGYLSESHFHWVTGDRFRTLTPAYQHKRHRWEPRVIFDPDFNPSELGYGEAWCACRAVSRWVLRGENYYSLIMEGKSNTQASTYDGLTVVGVGG